MLQHLPLEQVVPAAGQPRKTFYEDSLEELAQYCGDRQASVSREISKKFEETRRGRLTELAAHFKKTTPKGEFVLVLAGSAPIR